jgi:hypothetical protein
MTQNHLGGSYLKTGALKPNRDGTSRHIRCVLDNRNGGSRIVEGKFGPQLELPITIEEQQFVVSIPADKGDGKTLQQVFGPVSESWAGKAVDVFESETLDRVRVVPIG